MTPAASLPNFAPELRRLLVDPERLVEHLGLGESRKRQKDGVLIRCPAHEERHPSCSVRVADDGTIGVHCFACGFDADALGLIAHMRGLSTRSDFREVQIAAAEIAGRVDMIDALEGRSKTSHAKVSAPPKKAASPKPERDLVRERAASALVDLEALERAQLDYLEQRRIAAYAFALGCRVLPPADEQAAIVAELLKVASEDELEHGSIMRGAYLKWPDHRLLIPWRRRDGSVAMLQRRLLRDELEGERKYQVQSGVMVDVEPFGSHAFAAAAPSMPDADVVIVEGALDVAARMTLAMYVRERVLVIGAFNATAHDTHDWEPFVSGRRVRIALDGDKAGDADVEHLAGAVLEAGASSVIRERPKHGKDWNEALLSWRAAA